VSEGYCETFDGQLLWNPQLHNKWPVVDGNDTIGSCIVLENVLTCPKENMVLIGISTTRLCNMTMGTLAQGDLFTPDLESWNNLSLSEEVNKVKRERSRRQGGFPHQRKQMPN